MVNVAHCNSQWEFQDPRLEAPTIHKAYFLDLWVRGYTLKIWPYVVEYLYFGSLIPIDDGENVDDNWLQLYMFDSMRS